MPLLVDAREAARLLAISQRKLWDLTSRREITSLKIGRSVRYRVSDLNDWTERQANGGSSPNTKKMTEILDGKRQ